MVEGIFIPQSLVDTMCTFSKYISDTNWNDSVFCHLSTIHTVEFVCSENLAIPSNKLCGGRDGGVAPPMINSIQKFQ